MRCSSCYAENPAYLKRCPACGEPTRALEFCENGHLLAPDGGECAACVLKWPEVPPFQGAPVLRGVLWMEDGQLRSASGGGTLPVLALIDMLEPVGLVAVPGKPVTVVAADAHDAAIMILTRPQGISYCLSPRAQSGARNPSVAYRAASPSERIEIGGAVLRVELFRVPSWAGSV